MGQRASAGSGGSSSGHRLALVVVLLLLGVGAVLAVNGRAATTPPNDNFASAQGLSGTNVTRTGDTNVSATSEVGEPNYPNSNPPGASVWYRWTASFTGTVTIDTVGSDFDTVLAVYTGDAVNALSFVAFNNDLPGTPGGPSTVTFTATAGTTYQIAVDGLWDPSTPATGSITLHLQQPPANDNFSAATVLSGHSATRNGDTNVLGTKEAGEPDHTGNPGGASVWYRWTPDFTGQVTIDTAGSAFDTMLAVYTGGIVNALTLVASNDDSATPPTSEVTFTATAGTTYQIAVDGYLSLGVPVATGRLTLHLRSVPDSPASVTATPGDTTATVNWSAPANDGGSVITGYDVTPYIGGVAQPVKTVGAVTSTTFTGLTNGTSYTFKVAATNTFGTGPRSADSNAITPANPPGAPTGVTASAGDAQASVSWSAPASNGGSAITGYDVTPYIGVVAQTVKSVGVVTSTTVTGLTNGTAYTFKVAAKNAIATGAQSAASNAVTPIPATVPGAPSGVTGSAGDGQVSVSWVAPASDGGSAITGYDVTPYIGGVVQTVKSVGVVTSTTVTGLTNGTAYTFKVAAKNAVGTGAQSAASAAVTPAAPVTDGYAAAVAADSPAGYWRLGEPSGSSAADASGNGRAASYLGAPTLGQVGVVGGNTAAGFNGSSQYGQVPFDAALNPAQFSVEAWAKVTGGAGTYRSVVTSRNGSFGGYILYATPADTWQFWLGNGSSWRIVGGPAVTLNAWTHLVATFDGATAKLYVNGVLAASSVGAAFAANTTAPLRFGAGRSESAASYFFAGGLDEFAVYPAALSAARIQAHYNAATTAVVPGAPSGVAGSAGDSQVSVSWVAPSSDGGSAITGYDVTPYVGGVAQAVKSVGVVTSTTVTGLSNGTAYTFKVAAKNAVGTGALSAASAAVTPARLWWMGMRRRWRRMVRPAIGGWVSRRVRLRRTRRVTAVRARIWVRRRWARPVLLVVTRRRASTVRASTARWRLMRRSTRPSSRWRRGRR